jgi:polysaccharide pyruvyl transferase WcaK-like protein
MQALKAIVGAPCSNPLGVQFGQDPSTMQNDAGKADVARKASMNPKKIAFYGLFGQQNWGNECTLQAIIYNVRRYLPDAKLRCFCTGPDDTSQRYHIPAFPISNRYAKGYPKDSRVQAHVVIRLLRTILIRIPAELFSWVEAFKSLRGFDMLVVPGTGLLTDFTSAPLGIPYRILKWSLIAKLCRCKLLFVSVGAGPMYHPLTRLFIRAALSLAQYRSYRDLYSKEFLDGIGFKTQNDAIYPDLAFSLPKALFPTCDRHDRPRTVIGVGVKDYYGKLGLPQRGGEAKYRAFISKLSKFVTWLLEHNYSVRLLIGDTLYDNKVRADLIELLPSRTSRDGECELINQPLSSVVDVVSELASTDIVVSARFHNILLAQMLGKPTVSLSYHEKFAALMAGVGLPGYCHDIDELDLDKLTQHILQLEGQADTLRPHIEHKVEEYRNALDEQYAHIFK